MSDRSRKWKKDLKRFGKKSGRKLKGARGDEEVRGGGREVEEKLKQARDDEIEGSSVDN